MSANDITITIPRAKATRRTAHSSERSSGSDEEDSSGTGVHISPSAGDDGHDYSDQEDDSLGDEDSYTLLSKEEVGPSESASRLSSQADTGRSLQSRRRPSRREVERHPRRNNHHLTRARRQPHHSPEESEVGSHEDLLYGDVVDPYMHPPPRPPRPNSYHWTPHHNAPGPPQYGQGFAPQSGYGPQHPPYGPPPGDQLMRVQNRYGGGPQYPNHLQQYQQPGSPPVQSPYYNGGHHGMHGGMPAPMPPHAGGYGGQDMIHHQQQYMPQNMQPNIPHAMGGQGYFPQFPQQSPFAFQQPQPQIIQAPPAIQYVQVPTPSPAPPPASTKSTPAPAESKEPPPPPAPAAAPPAAATPAPPEPPKPDPGLEELKQMIIQERKDREAREAKAKADEEARIKKAEEDKKKADEIAAAAKAAAAKAKGEAEKKAAEESEAAAKKAAEEAEKIKAEAEEAMKNAAKKAAEDAAKAKEEHEAALAAATAPPIEKAKPIRFKDAVGRKFNFPFHLCATWEGMEDLIKQAFLHVDVIGQHVAEGHYDLIGPGNEIILPAVWETVIEPDWAITMHMWPIPEPEPEPAPPVVAEDPLIAALDAVALQGDGKGKDGKKGKGKSKDKAKPAAPPPAIVEVVGPAPPPPPSGPMAPPGTVLDGPTGPPKKKPAKSSGWSLFGPQKPKPKAKPAAKKANA